MEALLVDRAMLGGVEGCDERLGQARVAADVLHTPVAIVAQLFGEVGDDLDEIGELGLLAVHEVVAREQVEGDDLDAEVVAPLEELAHLRGARPVAVGGRLVPELLRPAPVASMIIAT